MADLAQLLPTGWRAQAACIGTDPDMWFAEGKGVTPIEALRICTGGCPVRVECLEDALAVESGPTDGVLGGVIAADRVRVRGGTLTRGQAMARGDRLASRRTRQEVAAEPRAERDRSYRLSKARQVARDRRRRAAAYDRDRARELIASVADEHALPVDALAGPSRMVEVVAARHQAMRLVWEQTDLSLSAIGGLFGGRDHTTVMYAVRRREQETADA